MPSNEREQNLENRGEWSFISPIGSEPAMTPRSLSHNISELRRSSDILTGAASPTGEIIALLHRRGSILLLGLNSRAAESNRPNRGGLVVRDGPITLDTGLQYPRDGPSSPLCMQFCRNAGVDTLVAVDIRGNVIRKSFPIDRNAIRNSDPSRSLSSVWVDRPLPRIASPVLDLSSIETTIPES